MHRAPDPQHPRPRPGPPGDTLPAAAEVPHPPRRRVRRPPRPLHPRLPHRPRTPQPPGLRPAPLGVDWHRRPNLGASFARAAAHHPRDRAHTEERLQVLIRLSADLLHTMLPGTARYLLERGAVPDWAVLLADLALWDYARDTIATRWLDAYYLAPPASTRPDPGPPRSTPTPLRTREI
ncbi:type I-E CRISPR-associated protein Cse2/CasB [Streptomyces sp. NPDC004111]|uniref:type I-E CRISPR-associated protein Cse2/CasB n=1 Tax=Streptomyces sp. NPDC004111 TaxID=3364690 RepID=UPI00367F7B42